MSGTPTDPRQSLRPRRARVERGIYRQPNGKYTVCFAFEGKPRFATIGFDLQQARAQRAILVAAARRGVLLRLGALSFGKLAGLWLARLEGRVGTGVRLGRQEITALPAACPNAARTLIATALYSGLRISELLALIWSDLDFAGATLHVRAQLSRATGGAPARREPPKTRACYRQIPLPPQLVAARRLPARADRAKPVRRPTGTARPPMGAAT